MSDKPRVILSGFADEAANQKTAEQQFAAFAALGLQYYTVRFIDAGNGIKNVMELSKSEISKLRHLQGEYGLNVSSIGSPIGKVKLLDVDDGTKNRFVPFKQYLAKDVAKACEIGPRLRDQADPRVLLLPSQGNRGRRTLAAGRRPARPDRRSVPPQRLDLRPGGRGQPGRPTGQLLAEIHRQVNHPAMVLIFDAANVVVQGYSPDEVFDQYLAMKTGLGWMHIKDYRHPKPAQRVGHVNEDALKHFVPADIGDSGHEAILRDFAAAIPGLERRLKRRGIPGVFLDLEPHVKGGGQFGGFSGPDGFGVALRGLCRMLDYVGIDYHLRDFDDILAARGF